MKNDQQIAHALDYELDQFEIVRQQHQSISNKLPIYVIGFIFSTALLVIGLVLAGLPFIVGIIIGVAYFALGARYIKGKYEDNQKAFTDYYKSNLINKIAEEVYLGYQYSAPSDSRLEVLAKALQVELNDKKAYCDDSITGVSSNGWEFSFDEIFKSKRDEYAFSHAVYSIKIARSYEDFFYCTPHENKKKEKEKINTDIPTVSLRDSSGNAFEIHCHNPNLPKQILSTAFLDTLTQIKRDFSTRNDIEFSFVDDTLYIVVPTIRNYLEVSMVSPINKERTVSRLIGELHTVCSPIHRLVPVLRAHIH